MRAYSAYKAGQFIALNLPVALAYFIADILSTINFLVMRADRRKLTENLRTIFPKKGKSELYYISWKVVRNFGRYLVIFFRTAKITPAFIKETVSFEGLEHIAAELKKGTGIVFLTAHLGNWELAGIILGLLGYPITAVAMPHKEKQVDDFFNNQRRLANIKVVPLGNAVRECLKALRKKETIALVGDRDFTEAGFRLELFGKTAIIPKGPALLSLKTGSPIIPAFLTMKNNGKFRMKFEPPILPRKTDDEKADAVNLTREFIRVIEKYIRQFPDQWYMFRRFWVEDN